jgi:hypothetical protein
MFHRCPLTSYNRSPMKKLNFPWRFVIAVAGFFVLVAPLVTFALLWLKGLPAFAIDRPLQVLVWVYLATGVPAFLAGIFLAGAFLAIPPLWSYAAPLDDIGRSFSAGAIVGSLSEALATIVYREVSRRPFSNFWIAGAMITGFFVGGILMPLVFRIPLGAKLNARA